MALPTLDKKWSDVDSSVNYRINCHKAYHTDKYIVIQCEEKKGKLGNCINFGLAN